MSEDGTQRMYLDRASEYDLLSQYFKYTDPVKYFHYYQKHLKYVNAAIHHMTMRTSTVRKLPAIGNGKLRFLHASPSANTVDIYLNGLRIFKELPYKEVSNYLTLPDGKYQVDIYPSNTMVSSILSQKVTVESASFHTVTFSGEANDCKFVFIKDDMQTQYGESKIRFIHLAADGPAFDLAVQQEEAFIPNTSYRTASNYISISPMILNLEIRGTKNGEPQLPLHSFAIKPHKVFSIILIGSITGEPPLEAIIIEN
ncbi:DUF4397 domain-containing protein [Cytobacillus purgationiresistens]|uniref:DUF4397 domain-containing protein n=1 Tax=Cytobacillus purgationiresistens TaxID=863449 RepID=A0ABU0AL50_9BACI|nr:DUF4397 domain-containing protein [Cytobacillus purgationiresistens]MDQ0271996.1 hypothetical protein [Cytobacillus purgationiresistens]